MNSVVLEDAAGARESGRSTPLGVCRDHAPNAAFALEGDEAGDGGCNRGDNGSAEEPHWRGRSDAGAAPPVPKSAGRGATGDYNRVKWVPEDIR